MMMGSYLIMSGVRLRGMVTVMFLVSVETLNWLYVLYKDIEQYVKVARELGVDLTKGYHPGLPI